MKSESMISGETACEALLERDKEDEDIISSHDLEFA